MRFTVRLEGRSVPKLTNPTTPIYKYMAEVFGKYLKNGKYFNKKIYIRWIEETIPYTTDIVFNEVYCKT